MSSDSSNLKQVAIMMISVDYIDKVRWSSDLGNRLKALRGDTSRREVESRTQQLGRRVAQQYIQQLEQPELFVDRLKSGYLTVSVEVLQVLCQALEVELADLFPHSAKVFTVTP